MLWSCEEPIENKDFDPPSITMQLPIHRSTVMHSDSSLHIAGFVQDESGVSQLYLHIHSGLDGHSHGRESFIQWYHEEVLELPAAIHHSFELNLKFPHNMLGGPYHVELHAVDIFGNATSHAQSNSVAIQVLVKRDDQPVIEFENSYVETGKMYVSGKISPKEREITFVSLALSKDGSGQLGYHVEEEYLDIRYYGQSQHLSTPSGILINGEQLTKEADGSVIIEKLLAEKGLNTFSAEHPILKIVVEDEIGSVTVFQQPENQSKILIPSISVPEPMEVSNISEKLNR